MGRRAGFSLGLLLSAAALLCGGCFKRRVVHAMIAPPITPAVDPTDPPAPGSLVRPTSPEEPTSLGGPSPVASPSSQGPAFVQSCLGDKSSETDICGPFSKEAVQKCIDLDGGKIACNSGRWSRSLHGYVEKVLVEKDKRPPRTTCLTENTDPATVMCGPFQKAEVEICLNAKTDPELCYSNRWPRSIYEAVSLGLKASAKIGASGGAASNPGK